MLSWCFCCYKSGVATIIRYNFQCSPLVNPIYQQLSRKRMFLFTCIIQVRSSFSPSLCMRVATVFRTHVVRTSRDNTPVRPEISRLSSSDKTDSFLVRPGDLIYDMKVMQRWFVGVIVILASCYARIIVYCLTNFLFSITVEDHSRA